MAETILKQYLDLSGLSKYDSLIKKYVEDADSVIDAKSIKKILVDGDVIKFYKSDDATTTDIADFEVAISSSDVVGLKELVGNATLTTEDKTLTGAINELDSAVDAIEVSIGTVTEGKTVVNMIADAQKAGEDAAKAVQGETSETVASVDEKAAQLRIDVDSKVASVVASDTSVTVGGTATAPTVKVAVSADADNVITVEDDGLKVVIPTASEYSITKAENSGEFAAVYNLTKDGAIVGTSINIPKDMVVQSGEVCTDPEGQPVGTYIKLVLQNVDEPLFINVGQLIEYVTSGSQSSDMVVINVSDDHKVTASVTDGTITLTKLETSVQTAIGKAHSHENADVLNGISADKVESWDNAEGNAKSYADSLSDNYEASGSVATAKSDLIGQTTDTSDKDTINGAKAATKAVSDRVDSLEAITVEAIPDSEITALFTE